MYAELILKKCRVCREKKKPFDFYKRTISPDGLAYVCKLCDDSRHRKYRDENREMLAAKQKEWRDNNKKRIQRNRHKHKYGLTEEQHQKLLKDQNLACAICKIPELSCWRILAVDHDHKTDKNRGLLCDTCNRALGLLKDNINVLEEAIIYLKKYQK